MPARLRPTAPIAADAILVGDPGRALLLAQSLLTPPKMSNHARGLWGYSGPTAAGRELTLQSTGMGGPSAALVLADLVELGVQRAIRVGTCTGLTADSRPGDLLIASEARAWSRLGEREGESILPDPDLTLALRQTLGDRARSGTVVSLDTLHGPEVESPTLAGDGADMQTAALFARGKDLGAALAAVLIVTERTSDDRLDDEALERAANLAGAAAAVVLST
jgi:uridine phosphorylase